MIAPSFRTLRFLIGGLVLLAGAAVGGYFLLRPAPPPIPDVDLSDTDPEIAAAVTAAVVTVKANPRDGAAWGKLGMVLRAHDFEWPAVEAFRTAERFDPDNPKWPYLQGLTLVLFDPDAGLACLERSAAKAPEDRPEPRVRLAEVLLERGRVAEAEEAAAAVVRRWPRDPRAGLVLARAAAERGDWMTVVTRTDPIREDPAARKRAALLRADAFRRLGRSSEADAEAIRAASLPADTGTDRYIDEVERLKVGAETDLLRGTQLLNARRPAEAVAVLQRAVANSRNPNRARVLLGRAFNEMGEWTAARRILVEAVSADPGAVEAWFQLGYAHFRLGEPRDAADCFERVVALKPDHALGYYNLGHARKAMDHRQAAIAAFEAALRCRPDHEPSRQALADLRSGK